MATAKWKSTKFLGYE